MQTLVEKVVRGLENIGSSPSFVRFAAIGVACLAVGAAASAGAADLYVSTNDVHAVEGSDLGWGTYKTDDGESHNAYTNLQQAVNAAKSGDTVWVEDGFVCDDSNGHYVTGEWPNLYAVIRFRLRIPQNVNITLRGRSGKWENGPVILGKWESTETPDNPSTTYGSNSVAGVYATSGTKIIGFRIQDCSRPVNGGGAFYNGGTLENCQITRCRALHGSIDASVVRNCVIEDCSPVSIKKAGVKIFDTLFVSNNVGTYCVCELTQGAVVSNCVFTGTSGTYGLVQIFSKTNATAKPLVVDCVFSNNSVCCIAQAHGGGYACVVSNCVFVGNTRSIGYTTVSGSNFGHHFDFYNCTVTDNGVGSQALEPLFGSSGSSLYNCLIARNEQKGSSQPLVKGLDETAPVNFYNCTLAGNTSEHYLVSGAVHAVNTVFSGNTSKKGMSISSATNCCLNVGLEATPGAGNVFADDPLLVASGEKMYRPKNDSPCRGAGSLTAYALPARDLSGRPRLTGGLVSIGCYEPYDDGFLLIVR